MLQDKEKREAIRAEFPHIPRQEAAQVASRIHSESDLFRIAQIAAAYVRHMKTAYDSAFPGGHFYSGSWQNARLQVKPQVSQILNNWR